MISSIPIASAFSHQLSEDDSKIHISALDCVPRSRRWASLPPGLPSDPQGHCMPSVYKLNLKQKSVHLCSILSVTGPHKILPN